MYGNITYNFKKIGIFHSGKHRVLEEGLMNPQKLATEKKIPPFVFFCFFKVSVSFSSSYICSRHYLVSLFIVDYVVIIT